jgi:type VI protein secretion system component Hcp
MQTAHLKAKASVNQWPGGAAAMATSVVNLLGIRPPLYVLVLTLGVLLATVPVSDTAVAQPLQPIGTLLIADITPQPVSVFSAGVQYTQTPSGQINFSVFTVTKRVDATSPTILVSAASGRHLLQARIDLFDVDGITVLTSYELTDVIVMGAIVNGDQADEDQALIEDVSLDYGRIKQTVFTPSGPVEGCWDKTQNTSC